VISVITRNLVQTVATCCLLAAALASCDKPVKPGPLIRRDPLDLELARKRPSAPSGSVVPAFLSFEELTIGIEPPQRMKLASPIIEPLKNEQLFYPEQEPNNRAKEATELSLPATLHGHIHPYPDSGTGDHDWFAFLVELDKPGVMEVVLSGVRGVDLGLELYYDSVKGRTRLVSLDNAGKGKGEKLPNFKLTNGRYYLHVFQMARKKPRWNVVQPYSVTLKLKEPSGTRETEPNDSRLAAVELGVPGKMSGLINRKRDEDWYVIDLLKVSPYSYLSIELLPPIDTTLELTVYTQAEEELLSAPARKGQKLVAPNMAILKDAGAYYLRVSATGDLVPKGDYTIEVANHLMEERCEVEPNDTPELAVKLIHEEPLGGWLPHPEDLDWFRLEPVADWGDTEAGEPETPALNLVLSGVPGMNVVLETFDTDGETLLGRFDSGGKGEGEEVPNMAMPDRILYLKVFAAKGYNPATRYILQARAVLTEDKESEPNNSLEKANQVPMDQEKLIGYLSPVGDRDCFAFGPEFTRLAVTPPKDANMVVSAYGGGGALYFQETAGDEQVLAVPAPEEGGAISLCLQLGSSQRKAPRTPYVFDMGQQEEIP